MSKKISVVLDQVKDAEKLKHELIDRPNRWSVLVGGIPNQRELKKLLDGFKVPPDQVQALVGTAFGYTNLEVKMPDSRSFYVLDFVYNAAGAASSNAEVMANLFADYVLSQGLPVADVSHQVIRIRGQENAPIAVSECSGVLHNVWPKG